MFLLALGSILPSGSGFPQAAGLERGGRGAPSPVASIRVQGPDSLREKVEYTRRTAPGALRQIEEILGVPCRGDVSIEWVSDSAGVREAVGRLRPAGGEGNAEERWVAGVALFPERVVVLRASSIPPGDWGEIDALLRHELAHVVLGEIRHPDSRPQPVWLHEGLAQWVAGKLVFESPFQLKLAQSTGSLHSFARLERGFPSDRGGAALAYQQAESMVRFIVSRFGAARLREILGSMAEGTDFYMAFRVATGVRFYDFEEEWVGYVGRFSALAWVFGQGRLLFFLGAIAAAVGWWFRRRRARRILKGWAAEEDEEWPA